MAALARRRARCSSPRRRGRASRSSRSGIATHFRSALRRVELLLPYGEGARLAELHSLAGDLEREDTPEGVRVVVRLPATVAERYERFAAPNGSRPA